MRPPPGQSGKKGALEVAVTAAVESDAARLIGAGALDGLDFEMVETAARRLALAIMGRAVAGRLNADQTDFAGAHAPCDCGGQARYAGRRPKTFTTALGELTLQRAWYHCAACNVGFAPRDRALGLGSGGLSPAVMRMVGVTAARVSFAESSALLRELAGLRIDPKQVERQAEALGCAVAADEHSTVEPDAVPAATLYLGVDGTGVPVRQAETAGRRGKQPDGSAKTREAKLAVVWATAGRDPAGTPRRDPDTVSCNAAIETVSCADTDPDPAPFAQRVLRETARRGFHHAQRRVVLGDGAAWIWNMSAELFPDAIQIVDIFHAKGHLFEAARAIYGAGTDLADQWGKQRRDELDRGRIDAILTALAAHETCAEARTCSRYITNNRQRMDYPRFRALGLCITTGVVEGACKHVVGSRFKRGGMHWTVNGANAILALRCAILSHRFDDFWERRAGLK